MDELPSILTVEDVQDILRIGRNTAYGLVRSGQLSSIRIGRQVRITKKLWFGIYPHNKLLAGWAICPPCKFCVFERPVLELSCAAMYHIIVILWRGERKILCRAKLK